MCSYSYQLHWSGAEQLYVASCPDFPGVTAFGETPQKALAEVQNALQIAIRAYEAKGWPLPRARGAEQYSGQLRIRMPRRVHSMLAARAEEEGVSLNTLAVTYLAEAVGSAAASSKTAAQLERVVERLEQQARAPLPRPHPQEHSDEATGGAPHFSVVREPRDKPTSPSHSNATEEPMTDAIASQAGEAVQESSTSAIEPLIETIAIFVRGGLTPDDAAKKTGMWAGAEDVKAALAEYRKRTGRIRSMREPGAIIDDQLVSWYLGPQDDDKFWPALEKHLRAKGRDNAAITSLDNASTKVVSLLRPPGAGKIQSRGLVVGYVQSGKTENFTAVISKAADAGYRFFVVLSGINNALRNQTQDRLNKDIITLNPDEWFTLTEPTTDFRATTNVNAFLTDKQSQKILGVIKKNKGRLSRLLKWLKSARPEVLQSCPVLIIDDEADQASPNTAKDLAKRTEINRLLVEILKTLPKAAYIGYTATPFANLLIDPAQEEDLYPRDFIVDLERPETYFGPERIFGRDPLDWEDPDAKADGLNMVRVVPDDDAALVRPPSRDARESFQPQIPQSLETAVHYFLLTAAARRVRGQEMYHCSMLVHTTEYTAVQDKFKDPIEKLVSTALARIRKGDARFLGSLRKLWEEEQKSVPPESVGCTPVSFDDLQSRLAGVAADATVKVEHFRSKDRIQYPDVDPAVKGCVYIVVGGNVLSRGLTIEGLTVSYFMRSASAYDTLLQMGRWFGYRPGYEDLPRLWMTEELKSYFYHLAIVEREIRADINHYKNGRITPLQFGVRIRLHPHLAVTSKLKMQKGVKAAMSFSGKKPQTLVFKHQDKEWLAHNIEATKRLLAAVDARGISAAPAQKRHNTVFKAVPSDDVLAFLSDYRIHENHVEMKPDLIRKYIEKQNSKERLKLWNVVVIGRETPKWGTIDLGMDKPFSLVNRARHTRDMMYADVKALMSGLDIGADVDLPDSDLKALDRDELHKRRDKLNPDRGLLLLYPINKDSTPLGPNTKGERLDLKAADHVIGLAMVFPWAPEDDTPVEYVTVDLSDIPREIEDEGDEEDSDE